MVLTPGLPCQPGLQWRCHCRSGALAGLVGQSVAYPLDVIRRRMQTDGMRQPRNNLGMMAVARLVLEKEGVRGMFKGLTLNWIKVGGGTSGNGKAGAN